MSKPELAIWNAIRGRRLGVHFRRQHAAGPYVLDFYCASARLCIEIDGRQHEWSAGPDQRRNAYLERTFGVRTLRIPAVEVLTNLEGVIKHIAHRLQAPSGMLRMPSPPPREE